MFEKEMTEFKKINWKLRFTFKAEKRKKLIERQVTIVIKEIVDGIKKFSDFKKVYNLDPMALWQYDQKNPMVAYFITKWVERYIAEFDFAMFKRDQVFDLSIIMEDERVIDFHLERIQSGAATIDEIRFLLKKGLYCASDDARKELLIGSISQFFERAVTCSMDVEDIIRGDNDQFTIWRYINRLTRMRFIKFLNKKEFLIKVYDFEVNDGAHSVSVIALERISKIIDNEIAE